MTVTPAMKDHVRASIGRLTSGGADRVSFADLVRAYGGEPTAGDEQTFIELTDKGRAMISAKDRG